MENTQKYSLNTEKASAFYNGLKDKGRVKQEGLNAFLENAKDPEYAKRFYNALSQKGYVNQDGIESFMSALYGSAPKGVPYADAPARSSMTDQFGVFDKAAEADAENRRKAAQHIEELQRAQKEAQKPRIMTPEEVNEMAAQPLLQDKGIDLFGQKEKQAQRTQDMLNVQQAPEKALSSINRNTEALDVLKARLEEVENDLKGENKAGTQYNEEMRSLLTENIKRLTEDTRKQQTDYFDKKISELNDLYGAAHLKRGYNLINSTEERMKHLQGIAENMPDEVADDIVRNRSLMTDALKNMHRAKRKASLDNDASGWSKFWSGMATGFDGGAGLTLGLSDLSEALHAKAALRRMQEGKGTTTDRILVNSLLDKMDAEELYEPGTTGQIGQGVYDSLEFMLDMAITGGVGGVAIKGVKTAGKAVAKAAGKRIAREAAETAAKSATKQFAKQIGKDIAASAVGSLASPMMYNEAVRRQNENYLFGRNEDGEVTVREAADPESLSESFAQAFLSNNISRIVERGVGPVLEKGVKALAKPLVKITPEWLRFGNNFLSNLGRNVKDWMSVQGFLPESAEEFVEELLTRSLVDQTAREKELGSGKWDDLFSPEWCKVTLGSVAVIQAAMGLPGFSASTANASGNASRMRKYMKNLPDNIRLDVRRIAAMEDDNQRAQALSSLLKRSTDLQRRDILGYLTARAANNLGVSFSRAEAQQQESENYRQTLLAATMDGQNLYIASDKRGNLFAFKPTDNQDPWSIGFPLEGSVEDGTLKIGKPRQIDAGSLDMDSVQEYSMEDLLGALSKRQEQQNEAQDSAIGQQEQQAAGPDADADKVYVAGHEFNYTDPKGNIKTVPRGSRIVPIETVPSDADPNTVVQVAITKPGSATSAPGVMPLSEFQDMVERGYIAAEEQTEADTASDVQTDKEGNPVAEEERAATETDQGDLAGDTAVENTDNEALNADDGGVGAGVETQGVENNEVVPAQTLEEKRREAIEEAKRKKMANDEAKKILFGETGKPEQQPARGDSEYTRKIAGKYMSVVSDENAGDLERINAIAILQEQMRRGLTLTDEQMSILERVSQSMRDKGYEWDGLVGQSFDSGTKAESDIIEDERLDPNAAIVTGFRKPQILKDGELVQSAEVTVTQGGRNTESEVETGVAEPVQTAVELHDNQGNPIDENGELVVEPINSIEDLTDEDFENPTRNVQLPPLPENVSDAIGSDGKPVVIKKSIFEKNKDVHPEFDPKDSRSILTRALYNPDLAGLTQPKTRPYYRVVIQTGDMNAVVVLDVYENKSNTEIVGWREMNERGLEKLKRQAEREDGQLLILSPGTPSGSAAALSALPSDLSSADKGTEVSEEKQVQLPENPVAAKWSALVADNDGNEAEALDTAMQMVGNKTAELEQARKISTKGKTEEAIQAAKRAKREKVAALETDVQFWKDVAAYPEAKRQAEETARKLQKRIDAQQRAEQARKKNPQRLRLMDRDKALGEPLSLEEYVLRRIATGATKFLWDGTSQGTGGLREHGGGKQFMLQYVDKNLGKVPEVVADDMEQDIRDNHPEFGNVTASEILDVIEGIGVGEQSFSDLMARAEELHNRNDYDAQAQEEAEEAEREERAREEAAADIAQASVEYMSDEEYEALSRPEFVGEMFNTDGTPKRVARKKQAKEVEKQPSETERQEAQEEEKKTEFDLLSEKLDDIEAEWNERIMDYIYEHYPTQATVSAATNSEQGLREREAMKKDERLKQLRAEMKAAVDKADAAAHGAYLREKAEDNEEVRMRRGEPRQENDLSEEERGIVERAKADGTYLKAPNGKPTKLTPRQWVQVRTKAFKDWFGDWEKAARIEKLRDSKPIEITGNEIVASDDLNQYKKNALNYGKTLRGEYTNKDTGNKVNVSATSLKEVLRHDGGDIAHIQSVAAIPAIIENGIYIDTVTNEDAEKNPNVREYQYYVTGLMIGGVDYTVKSVVAIDRDGNRYYDHALTQIEKGNLLNEVDRITSPSRQEANSLSDIKDKRLLSILQTDSSKVVDENGEPLVVYHGTTNDQKTRVWNENTRTYDTDHKPFTVFKRHVGGEKNSGFFFSDNQDNAGGYGYNTYNAYLNLHNPLVIDAKGANYTEVEHDGIRQDTYGWAGYAEKNGFDGVVFRNISDGVGIGAMAEISTDYVAFSPIQIKSATDNVGTFDAENPDIRFRFVGEMFDADGKPKRIGDTDVQDNIYAFAEKYGFNVADVKKYADSMRNGNLGGASYAFANMRRKVRLDNSDKSLGEFTKIFAPIKNELYEKFGNIDALREEQVQRSMEERNVMEAARKRAEEKAEAERKRLEEFEMMSDEQLDNEYFKAIENNDEGRMRDLVNEAARRNGYVSLDEFKMAHHAPSYDEEGNDKNMVDVANNRGQIRESLNEQLRMNRTQSRDESAAAIRKALTSIDRGENPTVTIYRAVPKSLKEGRVRNGDWVTLSKSYAEQHGNHALEGNYRIMEEVVPAGNLYWDGNDINEWGYDDRSDYRYRDTKNNRKLNDLITRDDAGNIIPLSQRFNARKNDARYRFIGEKGAANLDKAEEATTRLENLSVAREEQIFLNDALGTSASMDTSVEEVNRRFNEELDQQIAGELPKGHIYQLGKPSATLRSTGFPNMPIELSSTNLAEHAKKRHHPFDLKDVKGLVNALQNPIAVFSYGDKGKSQNAIVEIQKDGRHFLVGVHFNQNRRGIEVNDIRGIFPKDNAEWLNWISQGKGLYLDKEKIQTLINKQRRTLAEVEYLDLDSVAKVVQNFENSTINGTDSHKNPSVSGKAKREAAEALSRRLGVPVVIEDRSTPKGRSRRFGDAKGWFVLPNAKNPNGVIHVNVDNHADVQDVERTIAHEVVAHMGMRKMLGEERYNALLDKVYDAMNAEARAFFEDYARGEFSRKEGMTDEEYRAELQRVAADEYIAALAEVGTDPTTWQKVVALVREALRAIGFNLSLSDADIRALLYESKHNLESAAYAAQRDMFRQRQEEFRAAAELDRRIEEDTEDDITKTNERFNEQLESLTDENADSTILSLGSPNEVLLSAGISDKPMKLYGNKITAKARKHGFTISALKNLPEAVAAPIAVFDNLGRKGNRSILTELYTEQGNFLVTVDWGKDADIDFNIVSSVFGKGGDNIVDWINRGLASYIDKGKALRFLSHQSAPIAAAAANQGLSNATKIVQDFENPKVLENVRLRRNLSGTEYDKRLGIIGLTPEGATKRQKMHNFATLWGKRLLDSSLPVKNLTNHLKQTNGGRVYSDTDLWSLKTTIPSKVMHGIDRFKKTIGNPLSDTIRTIYRKTREQQKELGIPAKKKSGTYYIGMYLMAKHMPERNAWMLADRMLEKTIEDISQRIFNLTGGRGAMSEKDINELRREVLTRFGSDYSNALSESSIQGITRQIHGIIEKRNQERLDKEKARAEKKGITLPENNMQPLTVEDMGRVAEKAYAALNDRMGKLTDEDRDFSGATDFVERFGMKPEEYVDGFETMMRKNGLEGELDKMWEYINQATEFSLRERLESGLLSKEAYNNIMARGWKNYVPLRSWDERNEESADYFEIEYPERIDNNSTVFTNPTIKAKGRKSLADNPLPYIFRDAETAIRKGEDNRFFQAVARLRDNNANLTYIFGNADFLNGKETSTEKNSHLVPYYNNGTKTNVVFVNPQLAAAVRGDTESAFGKVWRSAALNWIPPVTRFMSAMLTSMNPAFATLNLMRDLGLATLSRFVESSDPFSGMMNAGLFLYEWFRNMPAAIQASAKPGSVHTGNGRNARMIRAWKENGGETGWHTLNDLRDTKDKLYKEITKSGVRKSLENVGAAIPTAFRFFTEVSENSVRLAAFADAKRRGLDDQAAAFYSKEVTTNFNRHSNLSSAVNPLFMFFNAATQGINRILQLMKENPGNFGIAAVGMMAAGFVSAITNAAGGGDDDDYLHRSFYVRSNNLVIGKWTIPLAHGFRMFYGLGAAYADYVMGNASEAEMFYNMLGIFGNELMPGPLNLTDLAAYYPVEDRINWISEEGIGGYMRNLVPSSILPVYEIYRNRNFMGGTISRESFPGTESKYTPRVARSKNNVNPYLEALNYKWAGLWGFDPELDSEIAWDDKENRPTRYPAVSASDLEHLISQYAGGTGEFVNDMVKLGTKIAHGEDFSKADVPVLKKLYRTTDPENAIMRDYYIIKEYADVLQMKIDESLKQAQTDPKLSAKGRRKAVKRIKGLSVMQAKSQLRAFGAYQKKVEELQRMQRQGASEEVLKPKRLWLMKEANNIKEGMLLELEPEQGKRYARIMDIKNGDLRELAAFWKFIEDTYGGKAVNE